MRTDFRIIVKEDRLFPVQAFFNAIPNDSFVRTVEHLVNSIGASFNDADCTFPGDLDPGDEPFVGVQFGLLDNEVEISEIQFAKYLIEACESYVAQFPEDKETIEMLLQNLES
jgi:hypothetical protein